MSTPPPLMPFSGEADWSAYEDATYRVYLDTVALAGLGFQGAPVKVRYKPETRHKGYGFWHLISEAPSQSNRNEDDRIPDLRRCERVRWVAWCIQNAEQPGFSWWENDRKGETHVVIWAEAHDYAVMLGKRNTDQGVRYYLLKTAYCLRPRNVQNFAKERDAFWASRKD